MFDFLFDHTACHLLYTLDIDKGVWILLQNSSSDPVDFQPRHNRHDDVAVMMDMKAGWQVSPFSLKDGDGFIKIFDDQGF